MLYIVSIHNTILYFLSSAVATYGVLRLDNGTSLQSGTLMFQLNDGKWGKVCNDGFNQIAANVACKQLGYNYSDYTTW